MTIRLLYTFLFFLYCQLGTAQESYSVAELDDFVNVYMTFKAEKKRNSEIDSELFERYDVSPERYRMIAKNAVSNKPLDLKPNEQGLVAALKKLDILIAENNNRLLHQLCMDQEIAFPLYTAILNKYQKDIRFQRSLKPHFETYINHMK